MYRGNGSRVGAVIVIDSNVVKMRISQVYRSKINDLESIGFIGKLSDLYNYYQLQLIIIKYNNITFDLTEYKQGRHVIWRLCISLKRPSGGVLWEYTVSIRPG